MTTTTKITSGFWQERQMLNRDHSLPAIIKIFEDTGRVRVLTQELKAEEKQHIFWESDLAKWMKGALIHLQQEPDEELNAYVENLIDQLIANTGV